MRQGWLARCGAFGLLLSVACAWPVIAEEPVKVTQLTGCETASAQVRAGDGAVAILSGKSWQPRSGEIKLSIDAPKITILPDTRVVACFRWRHSGQAQDDAFIDSGPVRILKYRAGGGLDLGVTIPALPNAPPRSAWGVPQGSADPIGVYTAFKIVPVADIRLLLLDSSNKAIVDVRSAVGVTSRGLAAIVGIGVILLALGLLSLVKLPTASRILGAGRTTDLPLRLISTANGYASLSQFQIMLWTLVVGGSVAYVMALSGDLIVISSGTLVLLGISGTATLGSKLQSDREEVAVAALPPAVQPKRDVLRKPQWSDLVLLEGEIDVTRVQMVFFTLITAAFAVMKVVTSYEIPEIPESFQILMGISNGVYLGSKLSKPTTAAKQSPAPAGIGLVGPAPAPAPPGKI